MTNKQKNIKCLHKSEAEVITRRRAFVLARLKNYICRQITRQPKWQNLICIGDHVYTLQLKTQKPNGENYLDRTGGMVGLEPVASKQSISWKTHFGTTIFTKHDLKEATVFCKIWLGQFPTVHICSSGPAWFLLLSSTTSSLRYYYTLNWWPSRLLLLYPKWRELSSSYWQR